MMVGVLSSLGHSFIFVGVNLLKCLGAGSRHWIDKAYSQGMC